MKNKIKRYRLGVSRNFPTTHPRKGEETYFVDKIYVGQKWFGICDRCEHRDCGHCETALNPKLHTIRSNYELWAKRMSEVQEGRAIIELFYWSEKPYNSKQVVFATLDKDSGCGVQKIDSFMWQFAYIKSNDKIELIEIETLSKNDGLSLEDFKAWFKGYDLSKPMAIIHFTKFRY